MKLTDFIVGKVGADKLLHFAFAGWAVALFQTAGPVWMAVVSVLLILMSVGKELWLDFKPDWKDLYAALAGMGITWLTYIF